jgi:DNA-binding LacI/PurR family transcriptional regulator
MATTPGARDATPTDGDRTPRRGAGGPARPTLEMVAALAGVSRGTASRVLSGATNVSPAAVEAVTTAAAALRYRPNLSARSLVTGRTGLVGLVVNETNERLFSDPFFAAVARGAHAALAPQGVSLVLSLASDADERDRLVELATTRLDGLLVVHGHGDAQLVESLVASGVPAVFAGRTSTAERADLWWVDSENRSGAVEAVEHLVSRGRRRIATITGPLDMVAGVDRLTGWRDALTAAGLAADESLVEHGLFSTESGLDGMLRILDRAPDVDAVFAANDLMAVGAMRALREAGRRIPDDVAVVGFDDSPTALEAEPPLSTVAQDVELVGTLMAELVLEHIGGAATPRQEVLPTHLVVRQSS